MTLSKKALQDFCEAAVATGLLDLNRAMIVAAEKGQADVVQALLNGGADVHASVFHTSLVPGHDEALCLAASCGRSKVVSVLLGAGADVHTNWDYPLKRAASNGDIPTLRVLLAAGADLHAGAENHRPDTPLLNAAWHRNLAAVKLLVEAGSTNFEAAIYEAETGQGSNKAEVLAYLRSCPN